MNMKMSMKKTTTAAAIGLAICTLAPSVQAVPAIVTVAPATGLLS